jgi:hypothetical protein
MKKYRRIALETVLGLGLIWGASKGACYIGNGFVSGIRGMQDGSQAKREYEINNYSKSTGNFREYSITDSERDKIIESQNNLENAAMWFGIFGSAVLFGGMAVRSKMMREVRDSSSPSIGDSSAADRAAKMKQVYQIREYKRESS